MKRSEINNHQRKALELFAKHSFALPPFATWRDADWRADPETAKYCNEHQMGWDITDFGAANWDRRGLVIFCIRNGLQSEPNGQPYAEKLLVVGENQETPYHHHRIKMEDIIVRGGGNLILEFCNLAAGGGLDETPVTVMVDGKRHVLAARSPLRLHPGQSVGVTRLLWHRFYGETGKGTVFVGEVSQVNDDLKDNFFNEKIGRFAKIDEDEPALYPLWNELGRFAQ